MTYSYRHGFPPYHVFGVRREAADAENIKKGKAVERTVVAASHRSAGVSGAMACTAAIEVDRNITGT